MHIGLPIIPNAAPSQTAPFVALCRSRHSSFPDLPRAWSSACLSLAHAPSPFIVLQRPPLSLPATFGLRVSLCRQLLTSCVARGVGKSPRRKHTHSPLSLRAGHLGSWYVCPRTAALTACAFCRSRSQQAKEAKEQRVAGSHLPECHRLLVGSFNSGSPELRLTRCAGLGLPTIRSFSTSFRFSHMNCIHT